MSSLALLALAAFFLVAPRFFLTRQPRSEIRGLLVPLACINKLYCLFWHRLEAEHAPLPEAGPVILIANHTCAIDHFLLQATSNRLLSFMVAKEFYDHKIFGLGCRLIQCIPVKRDGHDLGATRDALRALNAGRVVPIFPEGHITPESGRVIKAGKAGVGFIALKAKVPVIPAFLYGTPRQSWFWRCMATPSHARILYGPPVDLADLVDHDKGRADIEGALARIMDALDQLQAEAKRRDPMWWNAEPRPHTNP